MRGRPAVSIVLPTYNRGDVIARAVDSVRRQTLEDWELVVVDDGSTDGTAEKLLGLDPRIRVVAQPNQGVYAARNTGLREARGRLIGFLDSDDEWFPHFLEITEGFLRRAPAEHFVATEFFDDWGGDVRRRQDRTEIAEVYVPMARSIGSSRLDPKAGSSDDYLRVYETREPLPEWTAELAGRAGSPGAALYRGHLFEAMRWGYLHWLPIVLLTREAVDAVGPFPAQYRSAADYWFLARLAERFRVNMITVPGAVRHQRGVRGRPLGQDHLATGRGEYLFAKNKLAFFDELYAAREGADAEIGRIRGLRQLDAARAALALGLGNAAREHLAQARRALPGRREPELLALLLRAAPSDAVARAVYRGGVRASSLARAVTSGRVMPGSVWRRIGRRSRPGGA